MCCSCHFRVCLSSCVLSPESLEVGTTCMGPLPMVDTDSSFITQIQFSGDANATRIQFSGDANETQVQMSVRMRPPTIHSRADVCPRHATPRDHPIWSGNQWTCHAIAMHGLLTPAPTASLPAPARSGGERPARAKHESRASASRSSPSIQLCSAMARSSDVRIRLTI